ncbi:MAG TPA: hypothetical protein VFQ61_15815, partial [Polyangiaceae bacterium]|nr:hypothetical protein [Polyangiaceae bacterium]
QWDATAHAYTDVLGESACCADGVRDSCGQLSCYFVPSGARIAVNVELEAQMTPGAAQYEYRSRDTGSDVWSDWDFQLSRTVPFDALADEYCYEVEARSLVTGEVTRVEAGCAAGRDLALPNSEEDLAAAREKEKDPFIQCTVPPEGFEEVWCKTFEEARKTGVCPSWNERACEAAIEVCPPITVVDTEEGDASEFPKAPGDVLPGGSGSSATAGGGCSLTHPASGGTGLELLMMTALGVMIAGRRKKRGSAR